MKKSNLIKIANDLYENAVSLYLDKTDFNAHDWLSDEGLELFKACNFMLDPTSYDPDEMTEEEAIKILKERKIKY